MRFQLRKTKREVKHRWVDGKLLMRSSPLSFLSIGMNIIAIRYALRSYLQSIMSLRSIAVNEYAQCA